MICLDTNVVVAAMNERFRNVRARLEQTLIDDIVVGVPTIVLYELWYGIKKVFGVMRTPPRYPLSWRST